MNRKHRFGAAAALCVVLGAFAASAWAQEATAPTHIGAPHDWSDSHIVFTRDGLARHPDLIDREHRVLHQTMQRWHSPNPGAFLDADPADKLRGHSDWNVTGLGGRLNTNAYPAKYSFDPSAAPSCTNDYVVFGLNVAGVTNGQANLVAFNNLYVGMNPTGMCGAGPAPAVLFAYNVTKVTGGKILTSPILSEDGTKIAFVESVAANAGLGTPASAVFHVLTWTAGVGAIKTAAAPGAKMTSLTYTATANDSTSSPWIDYTSDTVYVGADDGAVYKITNVFKGTPTLAGSVTVSSGITLTSPVLDSSADFLMVGSTNGNLYQINPTSLTLLGSLAVGAKGKFNHGVLAAPIVDITNSTTFAVSSNNGTSAVLLEADTSTLAVLAENNIGQGSTLGAPPVNLYEPAFDNNYYNDPTTGLIHLCGTGVSDTTPYHYAYGFTGRTMNPANAPGYPQQLLISTAARCTGWTEFFNPSLGASPGTDFFFFGLSQDCTGSGPAAGCVEEIGINGGTTTKITATIAGGPTGVVIDNYSAAAQASSIYFTSRTVDTAYKLTQSGLQ